MISNDKNVDRVARLIEKFKHYLGLQTEFVKLDATEKIVRLITVFSVILVSVIALLLILLYLSIACALALSQFMSVAVAFLIVAVFYLIVFLIFLFNRKRLIEKPLVKLLASILLDNE